MKFVPWGVQSICCPTNQTPTAVKRIKLFNEDSKLGENRKCAHVQQIFSDLSVGKISISKVLWFRDIFGGTVDPRN